MAFIECEKSGSLMFNEPEFLHQTKTVMVSVEGQNFLEVNGLEEPSEQEIRDVR